MGVALPRPSGWPNITEKNPKLFIDHKLLDAERILKKITNFNFCQKMGVVLPPLKFFWEYFSNVFWIISYMIQKEFWFQTENGKQTYKHI